MAFEFDLNITLRKGEIAVFGLDPLQFAAGGSDNRHRSSGGDLVFSFFQLSLRHGGNIFVIIDFESERELFPGGEVPLSCQCFQGVDRFSAFAAGPGVVSCGNFSGDGKHQARSGIFGTDGRNGNSGIGAPLIGCGVAGIGKFNKFPFAGLEDPDSGAAFIGRPQIGLQPHGGNVGLGVTVLQRVGYGEVIFVAGENIAFGHSEPVVGGNASGGKSYFLRIFVLGVLFKIEIIFFKTFNEDLVLLAGEKTLGKRGAAGEIILLFSHFQTADAAADGVKDKVHPA